MIIQVPRLRRRLNRLRILSALLGFCLVLGPTTGRLQGQDRERSVADVVKSTADAVVLIVVSDDSGKELKQGSGFIISADGKVLTNNHVIEGAHSAAVKLSNGAFFPVDGLLASSKDDDLALIKVAGTNLPTVALGDTEKLSIGDRVIAVGSPLGLENTVSDGIVSAIREEGGRKWIQTTAPVSPGNSGGPLLDLQGKAVGVVTFRWKGGENLNFASAINSARSLLNSAHAPAPLGANQGEPVTGSAFPASDRIWTSMRTGNDYKIRFDGDYIYVDRVNFPTSLSGALTRSELKRTGKTWAGKTHVRWPLNQMRWCSFDLDITMTSVSESRIEGVSFEPKKFNVRKCEPSEYSPTSFTWIPKE